MFSLVVGGYSAADMHYRATSLEDAFQIIRKSNLMTVLAMA